MMQGQHGSASSTEWETDSDESESQSPNSSKPGTPLARVETLRSLSGPSGVANNLNNANNAILKVKSCSAPQKQNTEPPPQTQTQRRPPKPTRTSRPPSSLSTKSTSSVHPLLGLHPHLSTASTTTTSTSSPINITSHLFPPLTTALSHQQHYSTPYYHEEPQSTQIFIPPYSSLSRPRTTSTLSSPASSAISSLAHIPTRPPSPYAPSHHHLPHHSSYSSLSIPQNTSNLISFFPPSNPLLSLESIHPLLPAPFLGNHLTVLGKRAPLRESLERVRGAKARADAGGRYR